MYGILDLDRASWTCRKDIVGVILEHRSGTCLSVRGHHAGWMIQVRTPGISGVSTLDCPGNGDLSPGPDLVPRILDHVAAVAGPHVPQRLQDMYQGVRTAIILSGYHGEIGLNLDQGLADARLWIFHDPDGAYVGDSGSLAGASPLGAYQRVVDDLADGIRGLLAPPVYAGDFVDISGSRHWTYQGIMFWDFTYTQHERMDLLAAQDSPSP